MTEEEREKVLDAIDAAEELESITGYKITSLDWFKGLKELVADKLDYSKHIPVDESCEDTISRKHLLLGIDELMQSPWFNNGKDFYDCTMRHYGYIERKEAVEVVRDLCVNDLPPVIPKQRTGKWTVYKDCEGKTRRCVCDRCGYETGKYTWKNPNFCENCGAKMEGESDET